MAGTALRSRSAAFVSVSRLSFLAGGATWTTWVPGTMLNQGTLVPPSQVEGWFVSMAHTSAEIEATLEAAQTAFAA